MRVDLQNVPSVIRDLDVFIVISLGGRSSASRAGAREPLLPVLSGYRLEIVEDMRLCKDADLEVVACDIEKGRTGV